MSQRTKSQGGKKPTNQVAISEFKAKCLWLLDEVNKTKIVLCVTRRGKAIADVAREHVGGTTVECQGRVRLEKDLRTWVANATGYFREAPLTHEIVLAAHDLPLAHPDPADRFFGGRDDHLRSNARHC